MSQTPNTTVWGRPEEPMGSSRMSATQLLQRGIFSLHMLQGEDFLTQKGGLWAKQLIYIAVGYYISGHFIM